MSPHKKAALIGDLLSREQSRGEGEPAKSCDKRDSAGDRAWKLQLGGLAKPDWALVKNEHNGVVWRMYRRLSWSKIGT